MSESATQHQKGGSGSTNIQAAGNVHIGLSYSEVRQVALDVARSELAQLSGEAYRVAQQRAEQLVDEFLSRIHEKAEQLRLVATDPDFQFMLAQAKIAYARSGRAEQ